MENFSLFEKEEKIECKPFIKWVGGKGQLLPENCKATGYQKTNSIRYNFFLTAHEYLFIFKK